MKAPPDLCQRHCFPAELINHGVWPYHVFSLSFGDVKLIPAEHGVIVFYERIRQWRLKFGASLGNSLCRRRPRPDDKWHMDEAFIRLQGKQLHLWRAVGAGLLASGAFESGRVSRHQRFQRTVGTSQGWVN